MKKFGSENARYYHSSGTEKAESSSYQDNELQCMELTLDINPDDGSVFVSDFKSFDPKNEDPGRSEKSMSSSAAGKKPQLSRSKARAEMVLTRLKFITKIDGVAADFPKVEKKFHELTEKSNGFLHRSKFGECIGMDSENPREMDSENPREPNEFALALFDALGRRVNVSGDSIDKDQMAEFWSHLTDESFDSRLQIFFDMVDKDEDGRLNEAEVREIISLSASANKLDNIKRKANEYAALIMEALDPFDYGYITIENLKLLLLQAPRETIRGVESEALSKMLSQKLKVPQSRNLGVRFCKGMKYFLLDNWKRVWVIALWICVMVGLFTWKFIEYRKGSAYQVMGVCVCMAKGAAETLKLNMAMILLPVCKNTITLLRTRTKLGAVVPFDDSLNLHKVIAIAISIGVGIHAITHLACDFPRLIAADEETYKPMEQYFGEQAKSYGHFLKSVEVLTGTGMIILMTIAFTLATAWFRKNKLKFPKPLETILRKITGFNSFWYTHHLFVIVYSLLIVHGYFLYLTKTWYKKTTWMYLTVPMIIYLSERLIRALRSSIEPVSILKVGVLRGKALMLRMSRPTNFRYKSGQYMYLKCSQISSIEWHPFSITSAPGDDYLSVHIKVEGDWTGKLRSLFKEACEQHTRDENRLNRVDVNSIPNLPRILIDGPYGAPSQDYKNFEVVLLVGGGIGATPMISIVRDIINNIKDSGDEEAGRAKNMVSPRKSDMFRTKRAYFYWVTREQESFEWFKNVMDEVTEADSNKVIEMHSYCSSIYEEGDARSALITMLQSLHHEKHGVDVVSGTHLMSHFARPKWKSIYTRIAGNHPYSKVGVFYCGGANLAKELQHHALNFSHITSTKFCFHKENF